MQMKFSAHELLKIAEVLQKQKDGINLLKLYIPYVTQNHDFLRLVEHQLQFNKSEYRMLIERIESASAPASSYGMYTLFEPTYGFQTAKIESNCREQEAASSLLSHFKSIAMLKFAAALECADPDLRMFMVHSSTNSAHQAYDIWRFMNENGYYQIPVFTEKTTEAIIQSLKNIEP